MPYSYILHVAAKIDVSGYWNLPATDCSCLPYICSVTFCIEFLPSKMRGLGVLLIEVQWCLHTVHFLIWHIVLCAFMLWVVKAIQP